MFKWLARKILKKEIAELKRRAWPKTELYIDHDDADEISFWQDVYKWAQNENAQRWAFKEINSLLNELVKVTAAESHKFWGVQGAIEQMSRFMNLSDHIEQKLAQVRADNKSKQKKETEPDSISQTLE